MAKYELVSFDICPFVQRSVITLKRKQVDFTVRYINLKDPPQWFLDISPRRKVPLLNVDDTTLFESAVINEYLDEVTGGGFLPKDPLQKAQCRAWIEFASEMIVTQYLAMKAGDEAGFNEKLDRTLAQLQRLEPLVQTPLYLGEAFSLVDSSYAPFFMRHAIIEELLGKDILADTPKVKQWSQQLLAMDDVQQSVQENFPREFIQYFTNEGSWIAKKGS